MRWLFAFCCITFCLSHTAQAQNTTLGSDSTEVVLYGDTISIINGDTIVGKPITFRSYNERFIDFMFFDGSYNIVSFHIAENTTSFQFMLSSLDSSTYCFEVSSYAFDQLMAYMQEFNEELLSQPNYPVKCNYCQTLQVFWYDGDKERSSLKRSYRIPKVFTEILEYAYDQSEAKQRCSVSLDNFMSLEGFEAYLRGPESQK